MESFNNESTHTSLYERAEMKINGDFSVECMRSILGIYFKDNITNMGEFLDYLKEDKLDYDVIFCGNLMHLMKVRRAFDELLPSLGNINVDIPKINLIENGDGTFNGELRQQQLDGTFAKSLGSLYESAEITKETFDQITETIKEDTGIDILTVPLKKISCATRKAKSDYSRRKPGPAFAWLFDIVRGEAICSTMDQILVLIQSIQKHCTVVRLQDRFTNPCFNGSRYYLMNVSIPCGNTFHICELKIQLKTVADLEKQIDSHLSYEFFRPYLCGRNEVVNKRLETLLEYGSTVLSAEEIETSVTETEQKTMDDVNNLVQILSSPKSREMLVRTMLQITDDDAEKSVLNHDLDILIHDQAERRSSEPIVQSEPLIVSVPREQVEPEVEDDHALATSYNNMGLMAQKEGKYNKARLLFEKSLNIRRNFFSEEHTEVVASYNNLALVYQKQGKYNDAKSLYETALRLRRKIHGSDHIVVARSCQNLGSLLLKLEKDKEAITLFEEALQIKIKKFGETHPSVADSYCNIGMMFANRAQYDDAQSLYEKALSIKKSVYGEEHIEVAQSYNSLAMLLQKKAQFDKARTLFEKSLQIKVKAHGDKHPKVAEIYNNLGLLLLNQKKYNEAKPLFQTALEIKLDTFGDEHPDVAVSYNNLGLLSMYLEEFDSAKLCFKTSLQIKMKLYGDEHPSLAVSYNNLKLLFQKQEQLKKTSP